MLLPCKKDIAELLGKKPEEVRVGYASSIADLFHAGHVAYLREAKNHCDYLICGIVADPTIDRSWKNKPIQSLFERYIQVAACAYVDCVIPLQGEQDLRDSLLLLRPDVRFVGEEYKGKEFTGSDLPGIDIVYLPREHSFSSTDLRTRVYKAEYSKDMKENAVANAYEKTAPAISEVPSILKEDIVQSVAKAALTPAPKKAKTIVDEHDFEWKTYTTEVDDEDLADVGKQDL